MVIFWLVMFGVELFLAKEALFALKRLNRCRRMSGRLI
jgi:hypothetical protein